MVGSFWALIPAIVAIVLALLTKEVYSSLFIGILIGAVFYALDASTAFSGFMTHLFNDGIVASLSNPDNQGILIFLVILGIMVSLMNKSGGSVAFGNWAKKRIKTKVGTQCATIVLGILIFIDDYFNCLTVGSVMKPVTDKYGISREKLAYLIDSTAAPICIIAPISSWAAAVAGFISEGENGIALFCKAIPFNFYAIMTLVFVFALVFMKIEFGPMAKYENPFFTNTSTDDIQHTETKGKVLDLVFPIVVLILLSVIGLIYSGGFFTKYIDVDGVKSLNPTYLNFVESFAGSAASVGLVLGSAGALIVTIIYILIRKTLSFKVIMESVPEGFKAMVPAILILTMAWTLKSMTDSLGAKEYVANIISGSASGLKIFLPFIIFLISCGLAFATGTSWGTFGILIPICIAAFPTGSLRIISISACMAGAVCGDHCSPISDTTIMASAGAECNHVNHVSTQLPYVITVAVISCLMYIVAGITQNINIVFSCIISWIFGLILLFSFLFFMKKKMKNRSEVNNKE